MLNFTAWCTPVITSLSNAVLWKIVLAVLLVQSCWCSPEAMQLLEPYGHCSREKPGAGPTCVFSLPRASIFFRTGGMLHHSFLGFLCVCAYVCIWKREREGEAGHFLCPLIRSIAMVAGQPSWRQLSSLLHDTVCRRLTESAFWLS